MARKVKRAVSKGSQHWLRELISSRPDTLDAAITVAQRSRKPVSIRWESPAPADSFAEYSDEDALRRVGIDPATLTLPLPRFWPPGGPQWDGLGTAGRRFYFVEAKSHVDEMFSAGMQATTPKSAARIRRALKETCGALGGSTRIDWDGSLYQYCNRLAHLYFLREKNGINAYLVNVYFTADSTMPNSPQSADEWRAALTVVRRVLGLGKRHRLGRYMLDVFIDTRTI